MMFLKTQKMRVSNHTKRINPPKHENVHIESSFNKKSTQVQETNVGRKYVS
jgi:hypothetical protein